jgi:hypothetical protein
MANWRTNFYLAERANELANSILTMMQLSGEDASSPGPSDPGDLDATVRASLIADAEYFMSMDPARLEQEYVDQKNTIDLILNADAKARIEIARAALSPAVWSGDAARAFHMQFTHMDTFMEQQSMQAASAAEAAAMMLAVSVQFRESFYDLVDKTIVVCRQQIEKQANNGTTWKSLFSNVAQEVVNVINLKTPTDLVNLSITDILEGTKRFGEDDVQGGESGQVIDGYINARTKLTQSYEDNLGIIQSRVSALRTSLNTLKLPLVEPNPLPSSAYVEGPDFRYEHFHPTVPEPGVSATEVEQERERYAAEKSQPDGVISHRLRGER